jgi:hypothetical protein
MISIYIPVSVDGAAIIPVRTNWAKLIKMFEVGFCG